MYDELDMNADGVQFKESRNYTYLGRDGSKIVYVTANKYGSEIKRGVVVDKILKSDASVSGFFILEPESRFKELFDSDPAPEWNEASIEHADAVIIAANFDAFKLACDLRERSIAVTVGTPPADMVKDKTLFFLGNDERDVEKDETLERLKNDYDLLLDKYKTPEGEPRAYLICSQVKAIESITLSLTFHHDDEKIINRLKKIGVEYLGFDEEKLIEYAQALRDREPEVDAEPTLDMPKRMKEVAEALSKKFHTPITANAAVMLAMFLGKQGHETRLKHCGRVVYPYMGVIVVGESGTGKSPMQKFIAAPLFELDKKEGALAKERNADVKVLARANDKAEKALADAIYAGDKEAESHAREVWTEINRRYRRAKAPGHQYVVYFQSGKGIIDSISKNGYSDELLDKTRAGCVVLVDEGARLLSASLGGNAALDFAVDIALCLDTGLNKGVTKTTQSAEEKYGVQLVAGSVIIGIQPGAHKVDRVDSIVSMGTWNRFCYVGLPWVDEMTTLDDISDKLKPWYRLFEIELPPNEYRLSDDADKVYREWREGSLKRRRKDARRAGDLPKASFLTKLDEGVLRVALGFHLVNEATKIDEGLATLPTLEVTADEMKAAIAFCEALIDERDRAINLIKYARETRDDAPLSLDEQKLLKILEGAKWLDRAEIKRHFSPYKSEYKERAKLIDERLTASKLMHIGTLGWRKNKRHIVTPLKTIDASTLEASSSGD